MAATGAYSFMGQQYRLFKFLEDWRLAEQGCALKRWRHSRPQVPLGVIYQFELGPSVGERLCTAFAVGHRFLEAPFDGTSMRFAMNAFHITESCFLQRCAANSAGQVYTYQCSFLIFVTHSSAHSASVVKSIWIID